MAKTKKRVLRKKKSNKNNTKVIVNVRNQANANSGGPGGGSNPIYIPQPSQDSGALTNLTNHITQSMANLLGMRQNVKEPEQPINQFFYNHTPIPPTAPSAFTIVEPNVKFENFQEMTPRRPSLMENVGDMPKFDINTALVPTPAPFSDPSENKPTLTSDQGTSPKSPTLDTRAQIISFVQGIEPSITGYHNFGLNELKNVYRSFKDEGKTSMIQKIETIKQARKKS